MTHSGKLPICHTKWLNSGQAHTPLKEVRYEFEE